MADGFIRISMDLSKVLEGLDNFAGCMTPVARSMAVTGGKLVRDEAKARAPVASGELKEAIYVAYRDGESDETKVVYSVTWNSKKAPHGHLIEFGHWRINRLERGKDGKWRATKERLAQPQWVPAHPFLRPAYEASLPRLEDVMVKRGRERLAELLSEKDVADEL